VTSRADQYRQLARDFHLMARNLPAGEERSALLKRAEEYDRMCDTAMRGADALPGSKATSRAKGSHRNLGYLGSGRRCRVGAEYGGPLREGEEP
jgi:hypothetical protein